LGGVWAIAEAEKAVNVSKAKMERMKISLFDLAGCVTVYCTWPEQALSNTKCIPYFKLGLVAI
jgi:hypothetical protein